MTGIRRKNQGFGPETKTRDTHVAYNIVAHFYIKYGDISNEIIYTFQDKNSTNCEKKEDRKFTNNNPPTVAKIPCSLRVQEIMEDDMIKKNQLHYYILVGI